MNLLHCLRVSLRLPCSLQFKFKMTAMRINACCQTYMRHSATALSFSGQICPIHEEGIHLNSQYLQLESCRPSLGVFPNSIINGI